METTNENSPEEGFDDRPFYVAHFGKEGRISWGGNVAYGRIAHLNKNTSELYLLPHITENADGNSGRLEENEPRRISLGYFSQGQAYDFTPHPEGFLEGRRKSMDREDLKVDGFNLKD